MRNRPRRRLYPADRLARQRDDGRLGAEEPKINLAIAAWAWPSYFKPEERLKGIRLDIAEYRRPDPMTAPSKSKAAGLYMICTISKHAAEAKGYADALMLDLSRPRRRGDRRQCLLRPRRRDPHAGPGLLPGRHHAPQRHRACQGARLDGHRASDHAGRNGDLQRMLADRHRSRSHARLRDRALRSRRARSRWR